MGDGGAHKAIGDSCLIICVTGSNHPLGIMWAEQLLARVITSSSALVSGCSHVTWPAILPSLPTAGWGGHGIPPFRTETSCRSCHAISGTGVAFLVLKMSREMRKLWPCKHNSHLTLSGMAYFEY